MHQRIITLLLFWGTRGRFSTFILGGQFSIIDLGEQGDVQGDASCNGDVSLL